MQKAIAQPMMGNLRPEQYSENTPFEYAINKRVNNFVKNNQFKESQFRNNGNVVILDAQVDYLKPNGYPFQNMDEMAQMDQTMPRNGRNSSHPIANMTEDYINTNTMINNAPVVHYVRPGFSNRPPVLQKGSNIRDMELTLKKPMNANNQLEKEISLGDISGIFKNTQKRVKSAPEKERKKRIQAQKEYADKLRKEHKEKEAQRKETDNFKATLKPVKETEPESMNEKQTTIKGPHSENRFQGQFSKLTKDLFRKAQEKVKEDKIKEQKVNEEIKLKKDREALVLKEIQERNKQLISQQKVKGDQGPSLKEKELQRKQEEDRIKRDIERQKIKEAREKRLNEDKASKGLDQIDRNKLREYHEKKLKKQMDDEAVKRQKEAENVAKQKLRDKNLMNKDLIDFAHPDENILGNKKRNYSQNSQFEDDQAQEIVDKKAILREMQQKRKQKELQKQYEEQEEARKKKQRMQQLEQQLREQRNEIQIKQDLQMEKLAKEADKQRKLLAKQKMKKSQSKKDTTRQLNDLKYWIDEQIKIEQNKKKELKPPSNLDKSREKSSIVSSNYDKTSEMNPSSIPGNSMLPFEDQSKLGARENRYGLYGDNGYSEMVEDQRRKEGRAFSSQTSENILNFTQKERSPPKSDKKSEGSVDLKPVKESKRKIVNQALKQKSQSAPKSSMPGVIDAKAEAQRQKDEIRKRETKAVTVVQKWYRGWRARKQVRKRRAAMKHEIDYEHARFTEEFKINEKFNLNKFIQQKSKLRQQNQTEGLDDSIQENIYESMGYTDNKTESYIQSLIGASGSGAMTGSKPAAQTNNFFKEQANQKYESDPWSIIALFAKKHAPAPPAQESSGTFAISGEQMIPERERSVSISKRKQSESLNHQPNRHSKK